MLVGLVGDSKIRESVYISLVSLGYEVLDFKDSTLYLCAETITDCDIVIDCSDSLHISDNVLMYARLGLPVIIASLDGDLNGFIDSDFFPDSCILIWNNLECSIKDSKEFQLLLDRRIRWLFSTDRRGLFSVEETL